MNKIIGQTLVEVMVTVLFISVSVIALIRFQNYLSYDNLLTWQRGDASLLATKQIETLRNFQVLYTTSGYTAYQSIATGSTTATIGNTTYTIAWTVTPYTNPTYKNIHVVVSWTDRNSVSRSVSMDTNIAGIEPAEEAAVM